MWCACGFDFSLNVLKLTQSGSQEPSEVWTAYCHTVNKLFTKHVTRWRGAVWSELVRVGPAVDVMVVWMEGAQVYSLKEVLWFFLALGGALQDSTGPGCDCAGEQWHWSFLLCPWICSSPSCCLLYSFLMCRFSSSWCCREEDAVGFLHAFL